MLLPVTWVNFIHFMNQGSFLSSFISFRITSFTLSSVSGTRELPTLTHKYSFHPCSAANNSGEGSHLNLGCKMLDIKHSTIYVK